MSRKNTKFILATGAALLIGFYFMNESGEPNPEALKTGTQAHSHSHQQAKPVVPTEPNPRTANVGSRVPASQSDSVALKSLDQMARTMFEYTRRERSLKDLYEHLNESRQTPTVARNANRYTGEMAIVRTKSPLPGTRYFHAQYFTDENNRSFVQHMSFEFKPGVTAMNDALAAVKNSFPTLPEPAVRRDGYAKWELDDGYILWVKKMAIEDLQHDPFNAYTPNDVGTVRVAIEAEIH